MPLVDTSAWIEWLAGSPAGDAVAARLPADEDWLVPSIVLLELAKWLAREVPDSVADAVLAHVRSLNVVPLGAELALEAARVCREHKLATADAIVYACAIQYGADLLTCDAHFEGLPGVEFVPKPRG